MAGCRGGARAVTQTDFEQWQDALAERFPSTDIERPWDLAAPIFDAYSRGLVGPMTIRLRGSDGGPRRYLGASSLGQACPRRAWASWRGLGEPFEGRLLRLFRTGDVYEERMRAEIVAIGLTAVGDQTRFEAFGGRVAGHCDGFVRFGGLPWALWEAKTANASRFQKLQKLLREHETPLKAWDLKYWYQVHVYMAAFGVNVCLYQVTNKDKDDVLGFLIERDDEAVREAGEMARSILDATGPAPRGYDRPRTPECTRFCDFVDWCWYAAPLPNVCGTCIHWFDGLCALTDEPAAAICDRYKQVPHSDGAVSEWEGL